MYVCMYVHIYVHMYVHMCTYTKHTPVAPRGRQSHREQQGVTQSVARTPVAVLPTQRQVWCTAGKTGVVYSLSHDLWAGSGDVGLAHLLLQGVGVVRVHGGVEDLLAADVANASDVSALLTPLAARRQLLLAHQAFLRCPQP
jgi:hypothetical protein